MGGAIEEIVRAPFLHDLASVHDDDLVRHARDDAEVVRDEQDRHAVSKLQLLEQGQDLCLDRDVERRGWLIRDEHGRLASDRYGDHHPLQHPTGKRERILPGAFLRIWYMDQGEHVDSAAKGPTP